MFVFVTGVVTVVVTGVDTVTGAELVAVFVLLLLPVLLLVIVIVIGGNAPGGPCT